MYSDTILAHFYNYYYDYYSSFIIMIKLTLIKFKSSWGYFYRTLSMSIWFNDLKTFLICFHQRKYRNNKKWCWGEYFCPGDKNMLVSGVLAAIMVFLTRFELDVVLNRPHDIVNFVDTVLSITSILYWVIFNFMTCESLQI